MKKIQVCLKELDFEVTASCEGAAISLPKMELDFEVRWSCVADYVREGAAIKRIVHKFPDPGNPTN